MNPKPSSSRFNALIKIPTPIALCIGVICGLLISNFFSAVCSLFSHRELIILTANLHVFSHPYLLGRTLTSLHEHLFATKSLFLPISSVNVYSTYSPPFRLTTRKNAHGNPSPCTFSRPKNDTPRSRATNRLITASGSLHLAYPLPLRVLTRPAPPT